MGIGLRGGDWGDIIFSLESSGKGKKSFQMHQRPTNRTDRCYLRCGSRGPVEASVDVPLELAWQVVILTRQPTLLEQLEAGGKDQPPQLVVGEGRRPCAAQAAARLWKHLRIAGAPYGSGWWAWVLDRARPCGVS